MAISLFEVAIFIIQMEGNIGQIELCLGILYFTNLAPLVTNIITIFIMGIGAVGVYRKLRKKEEIPCACLGTVFKVPMTWVTLVEDLLMVIMAIIMIVLM